MEKIKEYIPFGNIPLIILLCFLNAVIIGINCEFNNILVIIKRFIECFFIFTCFFIVLSKLKVTRNFLIKVVVVLSVIVFFLEMHCLKSFGFRINETIVQAILLTNRREALEYLYGYIGMKEFCLFLMTIFSLIIASKLAEYWKCILKSKILMNGIVLLYIWGGLQLSVSFIESYKLEKNIKSSIVKYFDEYGITRCVNVTRFAIKDLISRKNSNKMATIIKNNSNIDNVILVMGESSTRSHLSVYGYHLKTTPYLEKWKSGKNLIPFDNVISSFCGTNPSFANMFTFRNYENNIPWDKSENLMQIMNECEYQTYWISNQEKVDSWGSAIAAFSDCARVKYYTNEFASPRDGRRNRYDELVLDFLNSGFEKSEKNFFVFHLMGSHEIFSERYPEEYKVFSCDDIENNVTNQNKKIIASYDNSILYTDYILNEILNFFAQEDSIILYVSDHGEELFNEINNSTHANTQEGLEIPFIVWCSDKFKEKHFEKYKAIQNAVHKPFMTDDLIHAVLDICDIESKDYDKKRSLFNKSYKEKRQRIILQNYISPVDFDEIYSLKK